MTNQELNLTGIETQNDVLGFIVVASVSKEVILPLSDATSLYTKYGYENMLPKERKLSDVWERCTNVSTVPRKDISFSNPYKFENLKARFYTSKIKGEANKDGRMSRQLVMEIINPSNEVEINYDIDNTYDAGKIADKQRFNRPICIMRYDDNGYKQMTYHFTNYEAINGYGYLQEGEVEKLVAEIKAKIELESGSLTNREIWKSCKNILESLAAYSLTSRGSAYFVPVGEDSADTRLKLKNFMDLINSFQEFGRSSCTIWEVTKNPTQDTFGSASVVLGNALLELSDRINVFADDLTKNKRINTMVKEWAEITNHVGIFKGILGNKLSQIEASLDLAVNRIKASELDLDVPSDITDVLDSLAEIDMPTLEFEAGNTIELPTPQDDFEIDDFEIEI